LATDGKPPRRTAQRLNDLTGKEWVKATRSWFVCDGARHDITPDIEAHPASFPPEVPERFIRFFTHPGGTVLDPFAGSGGTLVACARSGRRGIGVELSERYAEATRRRVQAEVEAGAGLAEQQVLCADAMRLRELGIGPVDYIITSPPYWDMLRQSRGGAESAHRRRAKSGLDVAYSEDDRDLGNIADYGAYLDALAAVMEQAAELLKPGRYATVIAQNIRAPDGEMAPLAWDIAGRLRRFLVLKQETLWCQDKKRLGCWGWPTTYVSNVHHHYCLHFGKRP